MIVVKVGGAPGNSWDEALDEVAAGPRALVVHGGSREIDRLATAVGRPPSYYTSPSGVVSRRCTPDDLEVVTWALAGGVQTEIVRALGMRGVRAVGLSGVDGRVLLARRRTGARAVVGDRVVHLPDDRSGSVESVDVPLLRRLLELEILPVVGPPGVTPEGEIVNLDADRVAADVAAAMRAEALVLLTNVPGLLRDPEDPTSRIPTVSASEFGDVLPLAHGRMRKKVLAAREALARGVPRVAIASCLGKRPIARALAGGGTMFS